MKWLLLILSVVSFSATAVNSNEVRQNINGLMDKINHLNQDLQQKQRQQKNLDNAINDSDTAISQSEQILRDLKNQRNMDIEQLKEISAVLPEIESTTALIQKNVKTAIAIIYQQTLQLRNDSVMPSNNTLDNKRKQMYLLSLLDVESKKYQQLQVKLDQLSGLNNKLNQEVARLNQRLETTTQKQQQLMVQKRAKINQAQQLDAQIALEQKELVGFNQKQAELNRLLTALGKDAVDSSTKVVRNNNTGSAAAPTSATAYKSSSVRYNDTNMLDSNADNSQFFRRKLAKPLNTKVLIPYGVLRHGVRNTGVLYTAPNNNAVFAVSDGVVMYASELPGLGMVIVINHGNHYMSTYGGVLPKVKKGQKVTTGQIIATSGSTTNQPMGGVYFELRHLGQPVNPGELAN